jgi:hypothetical protein
MAGINSLPSNQLNDKAEKDNSQRAQKSIAPQAHAGKMALVKVNQLVNFF